MSSDAYVLITPARDAAATLEATIESVVAQTQRPARWVIVSDASADGTDEIARRYALQYDFITLLRREHGAARDFGSKVDAFNAGLESLSGESYGFLGNLDADVTFGPDYFEQLLARLAENHKLGITGGVTFDSRNGTLISKRASLDSVGGAVQLFRRACFEEIGGYVPLRRGSEDALALHMARWKGWQSRSFPDVPVVHHGITGAGGQSILRTRFHQGVLQKEMGWSPCFVLLRTVYRSIERPYVIGAVVRTAGYFWASVHHSDCVVPPELKAFIRREQHQKLMGTLSGRWYPWRAH